MAQAVERWPSRMGRNKRTRRKTAGTFVHNMPPICNGINTKEQTDDPLF